MSDVATLRTAVEALPRGSTVIWWYDGPDDPPRVAKPGEVTTTVDLAAVLELIPPNAILIDPTAPETVAALAVAIEDAASRYVSLVGNEAAAAILPAFVARLRGET